MRVRLSMKATANRPRERRDGLRSVSESLRLLPVPGAADDLLAVAGRGGAAGEGGEVGVAEARLQRDPDRGVGGQDDAVDVRGVLVLVHERAQAVRPAAVPDRAVAVAERAAVDPRHVVVGLVRVGGGRPAAERPDHRQQPVAGGRVPALRAEVNLLPPSTSTSSTTITSISTAFTSLIIPCNRTCATILILAFFTRRFTGIPSFSVFLAIGEISNNWPNVISAFNELKI